MEDDDQTELLGLNLAKMASVARFCNLYSNIELFYDFDKENKENIQSDK